MSERLEVEIIAGISGFEKGLEQAQAKLKKFGDAATELGTTLTKSLTLPIVGLGVASIKAFGDIQSLKNGLTAVTGSAQEANTQFARLQNLAKLPGLGLQEVTKGSINLQTIGFSAEKAEKSMQAFGNAVATVGKGRDEFERAIYGLQQLANTDFPLGEDLNIIKDAIPQVTPLLKEAFGTARTEELQKLGITSQQVTDTIVNGLSKLPPVTGGIKGAFENLSDGVTTDLAQIGESINTAFDISSLIDDFIETLNKVTKAFTDLSPETQKTIIIILGVIAAVGPLLVILGTLATTVIPAVLAGIEVLTGAFAIMTGPIGLVIAAIALAVYLIIKYWDDIVEYFTKGDGVGVFTSLKDAFFAAVDFIKAAWKAFVKFLKDFWDKWGADIIAIAKFYFGLVQKYFKIVFDIIGGIFKTFTALLNGDWEGVGKAILDTTKKVWNGILGIIVDVVKAAANLAGKLFSAIGLDSFGKKLSGITNAIADIVKDKFSFDIPITVTPEVKDTKATEEGGTGKPAKTVKAAIVQLTDAQKKVQEIYADLAKDLQKNTVQFGLDKTDQLEKNIDSYQNAINSLIDNGFKPASKAVQDLIDKQKLLLTTGRNLNTLAPLSKIAPIDTGSLAKLKEVEVKPVLKINPITNFPEVISKLNKDFEAMSQTILQSGVTDAFASLGESLGNALASGGNIMANLGASLLGIIGGIAVQLGKAAIGIGVAMIGIKKAFTNPFTAIAAGIALIALGSFISSKVSKMTSGGNSSDGSGGGVPIRQFANGGIISGPTFGLMGEYAGARSNPEVVAPLNKLKGLLPAGQNDGAIIPSVTLRGEDMYISFKRTSKRLEGVG